MTDKTLNLAESITDAPGSTSVNNESNESNEMTDRLFAEQADESRRVSWMTAISAAGMTLFAYIALFAMETSTANYDPQFMRVLVERTAAYGGSYYSNGIHNKGPLEPFVYSLAHYLGRTDGYWFVIAGFTLLAACAVALAGAAVVIVDRGSTITMAAVMAVTVAHFTVSSADYAGVLYSRNMSVALLSIAFFVGVVDAAWANPRRRIISVIVVASAVGLAVQTLITAAFTGGAVLLWVMWWRRRDRVGRFPVWLALPAIAAVVFISAPLYYRIFGPWTDFVDGFWTHARFMSAGTGRNLTNQFGLGWDSFIAYYKERPELVIPLIAWVALAVVGWRTASPAQRSVRILLAGWWLGAWLELVLSQRYSSHYFSVLAVPTLLMFADLATMLVKWLGRWFEARPEAQLIPLMCVIVAVFVDQAGLFDAGMQSAAMVHNVGQFTERRESNYAPRISTTRAALDLISDDGDALLMWTNYPWPYLDLHRVSATRFIWKSFMVGEIYLGATGEQYVLPDTWDNFAADLAESNPRAYLVENVTPLQEGNPFADYVAANFTPIYVDEEESLSFRNDIVAELVAPPVDSRSLIVNPSTSTSMCERVDGTFSTRGASVIEARDPNDDLIARITVSPTSSALATDVHIEGRPEFQLVVPTQGDTQFSLIAGARSVVLMVDGRIVAAVATDGDTTLTWQAVATTGDTTVAPSPSITGCS